MPIKIGMKTVKTLLEPFFMREGSKKKVIFLISIKKIRKVMKLSLKGMSQNHLKNKSFSKKMKTTKK
jgi:hypothetical protein